MVDIERVVKNTVKQGSVQFGMKQTAAAIQQKKAKLVIIANNCPTQDEITALTKKQKIPVYRYSNTSVNLGHACGKQYPVSVLAVIDDGGTTIMQLVKEKK